MTPGDMVIAKDSGKHVLKCCNLVDICSIVARFTEPNPEMLWVDIINPISDSEKTNRWRKYYIQGFESQLGRVKSNTYSDVEFNEKLLATIDVYKSNPFVKQMVKYMFIHYEIFEKSFSVL